MSTDDSISEDVSSSGALSHCHASADGGKESETSLVSSGGTSTSGLSVSEDKQTASHTTGGTVQCRLMDPTSTHKKIRDICLSPDVFTHEKNLPFINPSSIETLRALVQEIRSSGETNPELWKDCEGRWLHLFQLVEKQYQEQILAQQEQYQCQIQLIQDEIKALVQIQNRQASVQPQKDISTVSNANVTEGRDFPPVTTLGSKDNDNNLTGPDVGGAEVRAATTLSSSYGTMWDTGIGTFESAPDEESVDCLKNRPLFLNTADRELNMNNSQQKYSSEKVSQQSNQQLSSGSNQQLTSWVQRNKLRPKKNKTEPTPMKLTETEEQHKKRVESHQPVTLKSTDSLDQHQPGGPSFNSYALRRSDSLVSEASGLTYWRLHENELYHPLPDSFDSGAPHLKEESVSFIPQLSLKEIYCNKHDSKRVDKDGYFKSSSLSPQPQAFTMDPVTTRHSDHTSGFTSPSHFSSPSLSTPSHLGHRAETPITPDSMVDSSHHNPGDTDCNSDASSVAAARHSTLKVQEQWGAFSLPAEHNICHHQTLEREQGYPRQAEGSASLEDPVVLSLLRQNLREKHSRHVADLKAYYEAEIQNLIDKLQLKNLPKDMEKSNRALSERCKHLEKALADATSRIQELEANNNSLEKKMTEWSERYAVAGATVKSLQKRLEENKLSAKDKDAAVARLKSQIRQLEETAQKAKREADEKDAKSEREHKMLQDLLEEYDSLMKKHEGLKSNLVSTENKLIDAHDQISELKRIISKMESQVKQLEHENQARVRYSSHNTQPSGAGLYHHPDLLLSPTKGNAAPDVTRTFPFSPSEQRHEGTSTIKSICGQFSNLSTGSECSADVANSGGWSSPDREPSQLRFQEQSSRQKEVSRKQSSCVKTPMMRAIIELEEARATQSRAPWVDNPKSTFGFVEQKLKVPIQDADLLQDLSKPPRRAEKGRVRALQRSLSPESHRSSSLPPPAQRSMPPTTPSKRETLLMPLSAKSSPKRCPTENFSTAFGHLMPREEHFQHSPRKRLLFAPADRDDAEQHSSDSAGEVQPPDVNPQLDRGERDEDTGPSRLDRLQSLSEAERLFDELTQEKLQIEAALRRIPGAGSRVSLQTRLDEVALENRLERLNRDLGSLRMTLKRFHVLRSSVNL